MIQKAVEIVCKVEGIEDFTMKSSEKIDKSGSNEFKLIELKKMIEEAQEKFPIEELLMSKKIQVDNDIQFLEKNLGVKLSPEDHEMIFELYK